MRTRQGEKLAKTMRITANNALVVLHYSVCLADEDSPINKPIAA